MVFSWVVSRFDSDTNFDLDLVHNCYILVFGLEGRILVKTNKGTHFVVIVVVVVVAVGGRKEKLKQDTFVVVVVVWRFGRISLCFFFVVSGVYLF